MTRFARWALAVVLVCGGGLFAGSAPAGEEGGKDPKALWSQGVDHFNRGEYNLAKAKFDEVLPLLANDRAAAELVERAGHRTMIRIMVSRDVGRVPSLIWDLYRKYVRRKLTDEEHIREVVGRVVDDKLSELQRWKALQELENIGQYAVPELAKHIGGTETERGLTRIGLTRIGRRGSLATVKLLDTGTKESKECVALALADIAPVDPRVVPGLKRLYDDPKCDPTVKEKVGLALRKISGLAPADMRPSADYYYEVVDRLYMERTGVPEEALEADGCIWKLTADGKLERREVPTYAWNEELAEELAHECLTFAPEYEKMLPLLLSIVLAQREENANILEAIKTYGAPPAISDKDKKLLAERDKLLVDSKLLAEACGARNLYRAVGKALMDNRAFVAAAAIELLPGLDPHGDLLPSLAPPPPPPPAKSGDKDKKKEEPRAPAVVFAEGQSLIDALSFNDDGVRVGAAIALCKMNPARPFPSSEKVVAALADAVSKSGPLQVLVVEEDDNAFKDLKLSIEQHGWGVTRGASGRDAIARAASFPPKDIVLIASNIKADVKALVTDEKEKEKGEKSLIEHLKADPTLALLPVAIVVNKADLTKEQAKFGNLPMIARETKGLELKNAIIKALGDTGPGITKQKREQLAARAAEALLLLDPRRTQMQLADAAGACRQALVNRPDEVRNPAARALGIIADKAAGQDLLKVFETKTNTVLLRGNALWALGRTDPALARKAFLAAQKDEKEFVLRDLAAIGFGLSGASPKEMADFLQKNRMVRSSDGGLPEGAAAAPAPAPAPAPAGGEKPAPAPAAEKPAAS